jgi:hypothetical protein
MRPAAAPALACLLLGAAGCSREPVAVASAGLPGQWSGIPYDFVTGEGDSGQPGLTAEVVGCLDQT